MRKSDEIEATGKAAWTKPVIQAVPIKHTESGPVAGAGDTSTNPFTGPPVTS